MGGTGSGDAAGTPDVTDVTDVTDVPNVPNVLVVSYRRADLLARCLDSVAAFLPGAPVRVWDNASDGSAQVRALARTRPDAQWTFCLDNVGFARAVNALAAGTAAGDLLLLNPDAELVGDLARTRAALHARPRTAAAAPFVLDDTARRDWDNAHRRPTLLRQVVSHAGYASRYRRAWFSDLYAEAPTGPVGYLSGSCLLVNRAAWEDVGPLDERYFLYAEEADWAARARGRGWRLHLAHEPGARHVAAGTVAGEASLSARSSRLLLQGQVRYLGDHHGPVPAQAYRLAAAVLGRVQRSKRRLRAPAPAGGAR